MKKIAFLFVYLAALLNSTTAFAQQPDFLFEQQYPFEWSYAGTHSLEICNEKGGTECYFVAACDLNTIGYTTGGKDLMIRDDIQPAKVLKLSPEGELLGEMAMSEEGRYSSIIRLYRDPSDPKFCLAVGTVLDSTLSCVKPYLAKFDSNLNMVWLKMIDLPEDYCNLMGERSFMDSYGDIVFCSWPFHFDPNGYFEWSNMLYLRLSSDGELLAMGDSPYYSNLFYLAQGDLFEYTDGTGDYGQAFVGQPEGYNNPPVFFARMNRDFTDFQTRDLVENIAISSTDGIIIRDYYAESFVVSLHDGTKYLSTRGVRWDGWSPGLYDEVIVSMKLDQNDSIVALSFIPHDNDSVRALAFCHGMDESDEGAFFICNGVYDPRAWQYQGEIDGLNRFTVTKTDADANIIWSRFYEDGEHVFQPCSVMATSDEGCLVTGRCWTLDQTEAELFVLKFYADGSLSVLEKEEYVRPYTFYPNPTSEQLRLLFSPDVHPAHVELYDLQGRLVHRQNKAIESIDMSRLPTGTYTMHVTLEDGKTYMDKVVKE
ncbi:MAG: T9SS type A sorting domain-containing protein [Bacteroidales bacterium]|nr:T9SS type A sorting domain-containing protein [Bacteroidales bacterium]